MKERRKASDPAYLSRVREMNERRVVIDEVKANSKGVASVPARLLALERLVLKLVGEKEI